MTEIEDQVAEIGRLEGEYREVDEDAPVCPTCPRRTGEQHALSCPNYDLVGDPPGMAGWWSGGFADNH